MEVSSWLLGMLLGTALLSAIDPSPGSDLYEVDVRALAEIWEKEHLSPPDPSSLKHADLGNRLRILARELPSMAQLEQPGSSTEGREIYLLSLGNGPQKILLWSQMHGDEATATSALLDLVQFLGSHRHEAWVADILRKYTLLCVPMLNPDGAERSQRRNAQGIDINRDARMLQTPEGRLLKILRDRTNPFLGFNLHNQNSLTTVGDTGQVATIALLAVASDLPSSLPEKSKETLAVQQHLTKQITAVLFEALSPFVYGHISRYDENFNPRAFGDNLTLWGTPIVLIESGGNPAGQPANFGVKLNFVGLLAVLNSLSTGRIQNANPAVFDALKMNSDTPIFDLLLRNAWICNGTGVPLFKGDVAIRHELRGKANGQAIIADVGDLGVFNAHEIVDCSGMMITPGLIAWDPEKPLFGGGRTDKEYLERGVVTLLQTGSWTGLQQRKPEVERWQREARQVNWGYVVVGGAPFQSADQRLLLAEWLAAGARGWVDDAGGSPPSPETGKIPRWFGVQILSKETADRYRIQAVLQGDPASVIPRWTSEAARQFGFANRGTIAVGAPADLVIWTAPSKDIAPADLSQCKPSRVVIGGRLVDPADPAPIGKFLGRQ
jgi:hypothetical protein